MFIDYSLLILQLYFGTIHQKYYRANMAALTRA